MQFSNPRYHELSKEQIIEQQEQLAELRDQHYRELVESGAARRIIDSPAITNFDRPKTTLTEGTMLYPFRHPQWNLSLMQGDPIYMDAGIRRPVSVMHDPLLRILGDQNTENYVLYMGRCEPILNGYSMCGYAAGLIFDMPSAIALNQEPYVSFAGIEKTDLQLIERQISEISAFAIEKSLDIIDPLTVSEGYGQIVRYDDDDYPEFSQSS